MKICNKCKENCKLDDFHKNKSRKDNRSGICKKCTRNSHYKRTFGISLEEYSKMLEDQNGVCAICSCFPTAKENSPYSNLAVDHCHTSGRIRGLLCSSCNTGIGLLGDTTTNIRAALNYLLEQ